MNVAEFPVATRPSRKAALCLALGLVAAALGAGCSKKPETAEKHLSRANQDLEQGKLREAEREYREVLRVAPGNTGAQRQLGTIYFEQGQLREAFPFLKR